MLSEHSLGRLGLILHGAQCHQILTDTGINMSKFEQALIQAISRNKMNSYERALAMLTMISAYPEHSDEIIRAFYPTESAPKTREQAGKLSGRA